MINRKEQLQMAFSRFAILFNKQQTKGYLDRSEREEAKALSKIIPAEIEALHFHEGGAASANPSTNDQGSPACQAAGGGI
jgi:Cu/Zn superoxide dismutase